VVMALLSQNEIETKKNAELNRLCSSLVHEMQILKIQKQSMWREIECLKETLWAASTVKSLETRGHLFDGGLEINAGYCGLVHSNYEPPSHNLGIKKPLKVAYDTEMGNRPRSKSDPLDITGSIFDGVKGLKPLKSNLQWTVANASMVPSRLTNVECLVSPKFETTGCLGDVWIKITLKVASSGVVSQSGARCHSFGVSIASSRGTNTLFSLTVGNIRHGPFWHNSKTMPWNGIAFFGYWEELSDPDSDSITIGVEVSETNGVGEGSPKAWSLPGDLELDVSSLFPGNV